MRFLVTLLLTAFAAFAGCEPMFEKVTSRSTYEPYTPFVVNEMFWGERSATKCVVTKFGGHYDEVKTLAGPFYFVYDDGSLAVQKFVAFKKGDMLFDPMDNPARQARVDFSIPSGILLDQYRKAPEKLFPEFKYTFGGVTYFWPSAASQRIRNLILASEAENYGLVKK